MNKNFILVPIFLLFLVSFASAVSITESTVVNAYTWDVAPNDALPKRGLE